MRFFSGRTWECWHQADARPSEAKGQASLPPTVTAAVVSQPIPVHAWTRFAASFWFYYLHDYVLVFFFLVFTEQPRVPGSGVLSAGVAVTS